MSGVRKFPVGTRVNKTMGVRLSGRIVPPFYWGDSTDGTYRAHGSDYLPVLWNDNTRGYIYKHHIERAL